MSYPIPDILYELGFGVRPLDFEDFETAAAHLKYLYLLVDEKLIDEGLTFPRTRNGRKHKVIILKKTLFRNALTEAAWHELGHAYFEHYGVRRFVKGSEERCEKQADDFSLCCRIPTLWIRTKTREMLLDEGFTNAEISRRKEIYDLSGETL